MRVIFGIVAGVVGWVAIILGISFALRAVAPDVAVALNVHTTTVALAERLAICFVGTLAAGWLAAMVAKEQRAALIVGVLLLAAFVPYHLFGHDMRGAIWTSFPLWYHLTFFVSLPLLSVLGGRLAKA